MDMDRKIAYLIYRNKQLFQTELTRKFGQKNNIMLGKEQICLSYSKHHEEILQHLHLLDKMRNYNNHDKILNTEIINYFSANIELLRMCQYQIVGHNECATQIKLHTRVAHIFSCWGTPSLLSYFMTWALMNSYILYVFSVSHYFTAKHVQ